MYYRQEDIRRSQCIARRAGNAEAAGIQSIAGNQSALKMTGMAGSPVQRVMVGPFPFTSDQDNEEKLASLREPGLEFSIWLDMACELAKQAKIREVVSPGSAIDSAWFLSKLYSIREMGGVGDSNPKTIDVNPYDTVTLATHGCRGQVVSDVMEEGSLMMPAETVLKNVSSACGGVLDKRTFHPAFCDMAMVPEIRSHYSPQLDFQQPEMQKGSTIATRYRTEFIPGGRNWYGEEQVKVVRDKEYQVLFHESDGSLKTVGEVLAALQENDQYGSRCPHLIEFLSGVNALENFIPALEEVGTVLGALEEQMALKVYNNLEDKRIKRDRITVDLPPAWEPNLPKPGKSKCLLF